MTTTTFPSPHASGVAPHRAQGSIGPNAILQLVKRVRERFGDGAAAGLLDGTPWRLDRLPGDMVPEAHVRIVVLATYAHLGGAEARQMLDDAGAGTARYLLANRIPKAAQWVIRHLPKTLGLRVLLAAIGRNSWTFAGSARFEIHHAHHPTMVEFHDCAMCRGMHAAQTGCTFYQATFRELLRQLVSPTAEVEELSCCAAGAASCRFALTV
jgi:divinyl protochlorophyllide a 8-vinyl-reductase